MASIRPLQLVGSGFSEKPVHCSEYSASQSSSQQALSLDDVIREALEKSPEAQSALHAVRALERRVPQAKTLPDPMVSVGWAGKSHSVQRDAGRQFQLPRGLTVSEQFPSPAS